MIWGLANFFLIGQNCWKENRIDYIKLRNIINQDTLMQGEKGKLGRDSVYYVYQSYQGNAN